MWTRGDLEHAYSPEHLAPWNMPAKAALAKGNVGIWPGYGPPIRWGYITMRLERGVGNEIAPGYGYAKDPSDPRTWRSQPTRLA